MADKHRHWRIRRGLALLQIAGGKFLRDILPPSAPAPSVPGESIKSRPPRIFASYAVNQKWTGSHRYCGGEKSLNNLVLLLRRKGFDAWMVTLDGKQAGWLAEQAPCLSLEEFRQHLQQGGPVRCVTSWMDADAFLDVCGPFYYWDHELATIAEYQFPQLWQSLRSGRIKKLAGFNRSIRAWLQTHFDRPAGLVRSLLDENLWKPDPARRLANRVGYVEESPDTPDLIATVAQNAKARGLELEFHKMSGDEPVMVSQMQTCSAFLVTNPGKSELWGEGGPLGPHESAACGTVPICFDLDGPREIIVSGYNGIIVPRNSPGLMAEAVADLFSDPPKLAQMSARAREIVLAAHSLEARWPEVREFLDLPESR